METAIKQKGRSECPERNHLNHNFLIERRGRKALQKTSVIFEYTYFSYIEFSETNHFSLSIVESTLLVLFTMSEMLFSLVKQKPEQYYISTEKQVSGTAEKISRKDKRLQKGFSDKALQNRKIKGYQKSLTEKQN